jgi:hypothetical protein
MAELPRTAGKVSFQKRKVYLSSFPGKAGARVQGPIAKRLENELDTFWHGSQPQEDTARLRQLIEECSDLVLLLDDDLCKALRESDAAALDKLTHEHLNGRELLWVLALNEGRKRDAQAQARLWLAKAETLRLQALRKVGGRDDWNFVTLGAEGLLHWFYPEQEKILEHQDRPDDGSFLGKDESRLGKQAIDFADHLAGGCPACHKLGCTDHG